MKRLDRPVLSVAFRLAALALLLPLAAAARAEPEKAEAKPAPSKRKVVLIAHRGLNAAAPENTLPAIEAYTVCIARGQGKYGTWGHGLFGPGRDGELHGPVPPYGPVNQAGLPCFVSMVLAQKCGVRDPELGPAIARSNRFFSYYAGKGFIPYGEHKKDWDWGQLWMFQGPLVVGDEIRIYYMGVAGRHWTTYHGDTHEDGVGLATLRLDGFVSVDASETGTLTTKTLVFIGDTLEVNANAAGGSIRVETLDASGNVISDFAKDQCVPITTDRVRHVVKWKGKRDCQLIQARPVKLRFHLTQAKLYSFTPRIRYKHYLQSYK